MGDKVLETSNSNINGIVNGDIGKIIKIDPKDFTITIQFDEKTVKYKKENAYGVEAMVLRNAVPSDIHISPISIEELFVFMVKEAK